jgi:CRP-like cAMP-binding protein
VRIGAASAAAVVFHRDDPVDSLHLVVQGRFAIRVMTPLGNRRRVLERRHLVDLRRGTTRVLDPEELAGRAR